MIIPINYRIRLQQVLEYGVRYFSSFLLFSCFYLVINQINHFFTFFFVLVLLFDSSRIWSTYTLIAHFISLVFICILIGLVANAITPYNPMGFSAPRKIQILRGQLAIGILMFLFPIAFLAAYIYTAFVSLFPFRPHPRSVNPPFPVPSSIAKY